PSEPPGLPRRSSPAGWAPGGEGAGSPGSADGLVGEAHAHALVELAVLELEGVEPVVALAVVEQAVAPVEHRLAQAAADFVGVGPRRQVVAQQVAEDGAKALPQSRAVIDLPARRHRLVAPHQ